MDGNTAESQGFSRACHVFLFHESQKNFKLSDRQFAIYHDKKVNPSIDFALSDDYFKPLGTTITEHLFQKQKWQ